LPGKKRSPPQILMSCDARKVGTSRIIARFSQQDL
jgi:hypothetical protein